MIQVQALRSIFSIVPVKELGAVKGLKRFVCFYKDTEVKIRWVKTFRPYGSLFAVLWCGWRLWNHLQKALVTQGDA